MSQQAATRTYARRLTEDEVLGVLALRERMSPGEIARLYDTSPVTVGRILRGESYRELTHLPGPQESSCTCASCATARLGEQTLARVRATEVAVTCMYCQRETTATVARVLGQHGLIPCPTCDGRKKK